MNMTYQVERLVQEDFDKLVPGKIKTVDHKSKIQCKFQRFEFVKLADPTFLAEMTSHP